MDGNVIVGVIGALSAIVVAIVGYVVNRRAADNTNTIALIGKGQDSLVAALDRANLEIASLTEKGAGDRAQIAALRTEIAAMRVELAASIAKHNECEQVRADLEQQLVEARWKGPRL